MGLFFWLCLTLLCFVLLLWSKLRNDDPRQPPKVPGSLPLIGHAHLFVGGPSYLYKRVQKTLKAVVENGGVMRLSLGPITYNVVTDPDDYALVSNVCLNKDPTYVIANLDYGLVCAQGDVWRRHRKLLLPAYNQQVLDGYIPAFNEHSRNIVDRLVTEVGKGAFDQNHYLKRATLELSLETTMGIREFNEFSDKFIESVEKFFEGLVLKKFQCIMNDFIFKWVSLNKKIGEANNLLQNIADMIIQNRRNELKKDPSLLISSRKFKTVLDILLEDGTLSDLEIRDEVLTTIIASFETTAFTLTCTLKLIASHPEVQEKIHDELNNIFEGSDRDVDKEDLVKLTYMDAVFKETMRLYSSVPMVSRYVHEDIKLKNYTLLAGTNCVLGIYGVHRSAVWGPDAEEFRPERWLQGEIPQCAFFAFSVGKRSCIGTKFAMMSMKTIVCHILRNYHLYAEDINPQMNYCGVLSPLTGHEIRIERKRKL